jgi:glucose/arabinose dehydrogenase
MKMLSILLVILSIAAGCGSSANKPLGEVIDSTLVNDDGLELAKIQLPAGFKIDVFARVPNARSLALSPDGTLFVGNRGEDKVYAIQDINGDWKADKKYVIASGLTMPNGVAFKDGNLYVGERSKLWKFSNIESRLSNPPTPELIYDDLPKDNHHGWKYIAFGPDGKLYVPVGAPCNICESQPTIPGSPNVHYAGIMRMNDDGSDREVYVDGVRNTVGFTWHPTTGEMWFTDNGRDNIGDGDQSITDNSPPCELNRVTAQGQHFGYPYCHAGTILDPQFGDGKDCGDYVSPAQNLGPHVAPLGLKFGTGGNFPESYTNKIFIAEHGSWNRSTKIGYQVSLVTESNGVGQSYDTFASGWLDDATQNAWGRPVDLIFAEDGSMLLSDDYSGTVYRIWYEE